MQGVIAIDRLVKESYKKLPKFPDGRINYHGAGIAPVVTAYIFRQEKLLLLKRSEDVGHYKSMWDVVSGYLDEIKKPEEKALEEVREELGIEPEAIAHLHRGSEFSIDDKEEGMEWVIALIYVRLANDIEIKLNLENTKYIWINPDSISMYKMVPGLEIGLRNVMQPY